MPFRFSNRLVTALLALAASLPVLAQDPLTWRQVDPQHLVFMTLAEGEVVIELNPTYAPDTVARFKALIEDDFYRALSFYRVIDGFVAQAGDESDLTEDSDWPGLPAEFERPWDKDLPWQRVQRDDLFAPETGFVDGFAAGRDDDTTWLTHCPGVLAMARGNAPDSGSTDFYIVIGQAPRYLDRNLTVFGRVIDGMDVVQRIRRGKTEENGVIPGDLDRSRIRSMKMAADLPLQETPVYYVADTSGRGFKDMMDERRNRRHEFFHHKPPEVLDVCQVPVPTRREKPLAR